MKKALCIVGLALASVELVLLVADIISDVKTAKAEKALEASKIV